MMILRYVGLISALSLIGASWSSVAAPTQMPDSQRQVVLNWFNALKSGNTTAIAALLGEQELSRFGPMLKSPGYAQFLRERYQDAKFEITGHSIQPDNSSIVDVAITLDEQEIIRERYVFERAVGKRLQIDRRVMLP